MATTSRSDAGDNRPLSPHLWHWRWHLSMATSIMHRLSGMAVSVGMIFLAVWFAAAAMGPDAYAAFQRAAGHPLGLVALFGFTLAVIFHTLNGIRHLYWDGGIGFGARTVHATSILVIVGSIVLTVLVWVAAYAYRGAVL
jgi:succinate dehydrogenase / fumarate reductase, cytochrome b subunit